tara:strand:+ start:484 stop:1119 length:636 start_codon:yes stop_codon:yes gene_type:complete
MAYALYRSAAASPNFSGTMDFMDNVDFRNVKSTAATNAMQQALMADFAMKSSMAKQALNELGATTRDQMLLDYYAERDDKNREANKKTNKTAALLSLLAGGGGMRLPDFGSKGRDPRDEMIDQQNFQIANKSRQDSQSLLVPDVMYKEAQKSLNAGRGSSSSGQVTLPGSQVQVQQPAKLESATVAPSPANAAALSTYFQDMYKKFLGGTK